MFTNHNEARLARFGRRGIAIAAVSMLGVAAFVGTANAADEKATITLSPVDTDIVAVSGKHFPAGTKITVKAETPIGNGEGSVDANKDGRILLGFQVPADFKGKIKVTATSTATAEATIDVDVPAAEKKANPAATTTPATEDTVKVSDKASKVAGGDKLVTLVNSYNDTITKYNAIKTEMNSVKSTGNAEETAKVAEVNRLIAANNTKATEMNASLDAIDKLLADSKSTEAQIKTAVDASTTLATDANKTATDALTAITALKTLTTAGTPA